MKIINKTHWRTDHLKAILQRCAEMELEPAKRRRMVVTIVYSGKRHDGSSGCAYVGGTRARIRIPKGPRQPEPHIVTHYRKCDADPEFSHPEKGRLLSRYLAKFDEAESMHSIKLAFASVACHEFAHNRGMQHRQMPKQYTWADGWKDYVAWAADMPLEAQTIERKVVDVQQQRYTRVLSLKSSWETKLKRAQAALRKLRARERYYERALAAKGTNDVTTKRN
jgi:hypothetical protein